MFRKFFRKEKPRVFLGTLAVVPRSDFKRQIENWTFYGSADLDRELYNKLANIFELPPAAEVGTPLKSDLVADLIISEYQIGDALTASVGEISFPLFWRPKIEIKARLSRMDTMRTVATFSVTEKCRWRDFLSRILSFRYIFRWRPLFDADDMDVLLNNACVKILKKMIAAV